MSTPAVRRGKKRGHYTLNVLAIQTAVGRGTLSARDVRVVKKFMPELLEPKFYSPKVAA